MANSDLEKVLKDYINKENVEGAFYIDGHWGSGKTFFINDFMSSHNKKPRKARMLLCVPYGFNKR